MNWNKSIRQFHRWMAATFALLVVANIIAFALGQEIAWLYMLPLLPLALLLLSGLYLFVLPYLSAWRSGGGAIRS